MTEICGIVRMRCHVFPAFLSNISATDMYNIGKVCGLVYVFYVEDADLAPLDIMRLARYLCPSPDKSG
jgi:hypothetical protein